MLWFGAAGGLVGWICARRTRWAIFFLVSAVLALIGSLVARRFESASLVSVLLFWATAQAAWFLANLLAAGRREEANVGAEV